MTKLIKDPKIRPKDKISNTYKWKAEFFSVKFSKSKSTLGLIENASTGSKGNFIKGRSLGPAITIQAWLLDSFDP